MTTTWTKSKNPRIRDQADARGEPVPVGKTTAEIRAMGYEIDSDVSDFSVLLEEPRSPTGYMLAFPLAKMEEMLEATRDAELDEELTMRLDADGKETFGREAIITAAWLRKTKVLALVGTIHPGWATVRSLKIEDGFVIGLQWDRVPARAPTDLDFEEESARRVALGMPPLEEWRRPDKHEFRIATMAWMADAAGKLTGFEENSLAPKEPSEKP